MEITITLHLTKPKILTKILIWKNPIAIQIELKTKNLLKSCFQKKKVLLSTSQPPDIRKLLTTAKFERLLIPKQTKQVGFFPCTDCIYHENCYFKECLSRPFKSKKKLLTYHYKHYFGCNNIVISSILDALKD